MPAVRLKLSNTVTLCTHHPSSRAPTAAAATSLTLITNTTRRRSLPPCAHLSCYNKHRNSLLHFTLPLKNSPFLSVPLLRHFPSFSHKSGSDSPGSGFIGSENNEKNDAVKGPNDKPAKLLTLPTVLTLGRVAAVPLLICMFYMDSWWGRIGTTSIFLAAAITDWLDGYLARKMSLGSAFGAFLDPVADKLMVAATLLLLCSRHFHVTMFGPVPWLLTLPSIAIIGREITMSAVREWAASQNTKLLEAVAVNNLGKWKTATQMTALTILLATRDMRGTDALVASGVVLLYISAGLSVWSLAVYMSKIWRILLE